ncbi:MAG: O-antigen ligase family protein, partial [bacterium]
IKLFYYDLQVKFEKYVTCFALISLFFIVWQTLYPYSILHIANKLDISGMYNTTRPGSGFTYNNFIIYTTAYRPEYFFQRNAGFCWEPGPFSIYLNIAIFLNLMRTNKKLKNNFALYILFVALLTTQSTTGILAFSLMILYLFYYDFKGKNKYLYILFFIYIFVYIFFNVDFMYEKIVNLIEGGKNIEDTLQRAWQNKARYSGGRFGGAYIAWQDLKNYPFFGIGGSSALSYGYLDEGVGVAIISGLSSIISTYGLYGIIFYIFFTFKSSIYLAGKFKSNLKYGLFVIILISSLSFSLHSQVMLFTFIFYAAFVDENMKQIKQKSY